MRTFSIVNPEIITNTLNPFIFVFAGEAPGVVCREIERAPGVAAGLRGHLAERGVLVVRGDASRALVEDGFADVLVAVMGVEEREVALRRARLPVQGARHGRRPVGIRREGEAAPGVVGVACRHAACPDPCCEIAVIGVSIARTPPVCIELLRGESRRLPYARGCPSSDSMRSVHL